MKITKSKLREIVQEEYFNYLVEKNVPTNPSKWSYYKSQAKKKFDVYPSAYANAWAAKMYKKAGGGWKKGKKENIELKKKDKNSSIPYGSGYDKVEEKRGPCWVGYKQVGMKKKGNKMVPNCVKEDKIQEGIEYHIENKIPFYDNVFRLYSENYFKFFNEARKMLKNGLFKKLHAVDHEMLESDIGKIGIYEGEKVLLDIPFVMKEAEYRGRKVKLSKPKRGGDKKFYVYVKDPKSGNVRKVSFGAKGGGGKLAVKLKDPKARKAFSDRHNCPQKKDKTKAGYWACRLPRYAKSLGLSGGGTFW